MFEPGNVDECAAQVLEVATSLDRVRAKMALIGPNASLTRAMHWKDSALGLARSGRHSLKESQNLRSECANGAAGASAAPNDCPRVKIWIDMDNTPHVPLFIPIIRELEQRGHKILLTARDAFQVFELAVKKGLACVRVRRHYGKNRFMKVFGVFWRSAQLAPHCLHERPQLTLSHGSRSKEVLGRILGIPTVSMGDYECSAKIPLAPPRWAIVPDAISAEEAGCHLESRRMVRWAGGFQNTHTHA